MFEHVWSIVCEDSIIDKITNNVSLLKVLEAIDVEFKLVKDKKTPIMKDGMKVVIPMKFHVVSLFKTAEHGLEEVGDGRITFEDPEGDKLASLDFAVNFETKPRVRHRSIISGLPATKSGEYFFTIEYKDKNDKNWTVAARLPLEVKIKEIEE